MTVGVRPGVRMLSTLTLAALVGATVFGLVASFQGLVHARLTGRPASLDPLLAHLPYWLLWVAAVPVVWRLRPAGPGRSRGRGRWIARHVVLAVGVLLVQSGALYGWQRLAGLTDVTVPLWLGAVGIGYLRLVPNALIYVLLLVLIWAAASSSAAPAVPVVTSDGSGSPSPTQARTSGPLVHLAIKQHGRVRLLKVNEIDWIQAADYCVKVHAAGRVMVIRETMASLEAQLDPARFCRVHRSSIVNLDRVSEFRAASKGEHIVVLENGRKIPVNRTRRKRVEAALR